MALNIIFGSDTAILAERLSRDILESRNGRNPMEPVTILVPNRNMEKWLRFRIAENNGIAANLRFPYLENGLWDYVGEIGMRNGRVAVDAAGLPDIARIDEETVTARLAACLLRDAAKTGGRESQLISYCMAGGGIGEPGFSIRLWQLSGRLAHLFREYEFNRTDMVLGWLRGDVDPACGHLAAEQARLYRECCSTAVHDWDRVEGVPRRSLFQLGEQVFPTDGQRDSSHGRGVGGPLFIFGLSTLSRYHCKLLWDIAGHVNVRLYHVNNCREYWQDAATPFEERWRRISRTIVGGAALEPVAEELQFDWGLDENPLLKAWGKAGRETVKLLSELEDQPGVVQTEWIDGDDALGPGDTVLRRVQHGIRNRTSDVGRTTQDGSVVVCNCPGKLREVEAVAERITALVQADPGLKLSDIVVLVTDMEAYKPLISQVFDRDRDPAGNGWDALPYNLADSTARTDSLYGAGVRSLLALLDGDFSRRAVFELFYNPCFLTAAGVSTALVDSWVKLADRLGIFHDFEPAGGSPDEAFTWIQGLRRLRFGRVMDVRDDAPPPGPGDQNPFARIYPFVPSDDGVAADQFCETVEMLAARLTRLTEADMRPGEWGALFTGLFDSFLAVPSDRPGEAMVRGALYAGLDTFFSEGSCLESALDLLVAGRSGAAPGVHSSLAVEIVRGMLGSIPTGRGSYLSDGVTVATLKPMRPIPFRVAFVLGLEEGAFPGSARESSLDLRGRDRRIGDVTTPDSGRYMFLETLMSTGEKLILSYDGWDTRKDELHEPCSVVRQLCSFINGNVLETGPDGKPTDFVEENVPLSPWGTRYVETDPPVTPAARRMHDRAVTCLLGARSGNALTELSATVSEALRDSGLTAVDRALLESVADALARESGSLKPAPDRFHAVAQVPGEVTKIRIRDLAAFLEDPFKARLRRALFCREDDGQDAARLEDEAFKYETFAARDLQVGWLRDALKGVGPDEAMERMKASGVAMHLRSAAPADYFRALADDDVFKSLAVGPDDFSSLLAGRNPVMDVAMGVDAAGGRRPGRRLGSARLRLAVESGDPRDIELSGIVDFVVDPDFGMPETFGVVSASGGKDGDTFPKGLLVPALFGMAMNGFCRGLPDDEPTIFRLAGVFAAGVPTRTMVMTPRKCRDYLRAVIADYLDDAALLENLPMRVVSGDKAMVDAVLSGMPPVEDEDFLRRLRAKVDQLVNDANQMYFATTLQKLAWGDSKLPGRVFETVSRRYGVLWGCRKG